MVSIKEAVEQATAFAREVLGNERVQGLRLEEVESRSVEGQDAWVITLSMISQDVPRMIEAVMGQLGRREYKAFVVLKADGEVTSMKTRELAGT